MKISKRAKIAGIVIVVVIMAVFAFSSVIGTDAMSNLATGSEKLMPSGTPAGKALVVYNPGLFGAAKDAATKIADDLKTDGYEVDLAGIKSAAASNVTGYDIIVVGGPVYGGKVSSSVQSYLKDLTPLAGTKVGAFATGSYFRADAKECFPAEADLKAVMMLFNGDDADKNSAEFVAALLQ